MRPIDADEVIKKRYSIIARHYHVISDDWEVADVEDILNAPTIEAEPIKRGKWIYDNQFHWYRASCSECGYKRVTDIKAEKWNGWKYCPNCGAKMEDDDEIERY